MLFVMLAKQWLINFLDFTMCHCEQLFPVFLDKKLLAFQWRKESYLRLRLFLVVLFAVPWEFHQFDEEIYHVVLRTSLWIHWHLYNTDSLDFTVVFLECNGNLFIPCWQKNRRILVSRQIKALHSQCNARRFLAYYKQSYCKYTQIYIVFHTHEG